MLLRLLLWDSQVGLGLVVFVFVVWRSQLTFMPEAWDYYYVYESDFIRELKDIVANGLPSADLGVKPYIGLPGQTANWSDFVWGPDGKYISFVRMAVVVFIADAVASGVLSGDLPQWLLADLSGLSATHEILGSPMERSISSLKNTMLAASQNRIADPLLLDHMLQNMRGGGAADPKKFVNQYNSSVFYSEDLQLKEGAAKRQVLSASEPKLPHIGPCLANPA